MKFDKNHEKISKSGNCPSAPRLYPLPSTLYTLQTLYPIDFSLGRIEEV